MNVPAVLQLELDTFPGFMLSVVEDSDLSLGTGHISQITDDAADGYRTTAADSLRLDQQLCFAVYSCSNRVARLYRQFLQPIGITFTQYLVLLALWEKDSRNISELAHVLDLEPNTITPMVKRMENLGLVSRSRHPFDERQVRVALTDKGRNLRADALALRNDLQSRFGLPAERLSEIRESVDQFADRIAMIMA